MMSVLRGGGEGITVTDYSRTGAPFALFATHERRRNK
jgi:hypothetical protein